jgi:hypothetical protein
MKRKSLVVFQNKKRAHLLMVPAFLLLGLSLAGCDLLKPALQKAQKKDQRSESSADPSGEEIMTKGEKFAFHRWLVTEMLEQVYARPVSSNETVDNWANVFSQRGSMEGVYRGMVLSTDYAALETGRADLKALRFFAQEMSAMDHPNAKDSDDAVKALAEKYAKEYMGRPLFTLKRILGDRVIEEAERRKGDKDRLATWYANFVGRWTKAGVPFGLPQRDKPDEAFHFKWATENNLGMLEWELLNRVHRVLNAYGGVAAAVAPKAAEAAPNPAGK